MSVTAVSSETGAAYENTTYSAFGNPLSDTGSTSNSLKYTGRELDVDTSLYYYRARYDDTSIGRFLCEDPKGFAAGVNFYAYAGNNPVNFNDPAGQDVTCTFTCNVSYPGSFTTTPFPRPQGFPDKINSSSSTYHLLVTNVPITNTSLSQDQVNAALVANPTPGQTNNPATSAGSLNNASPGLPLSMVLGDSWPVTSYLVRDTQNGAPIVLNVTQPGHPLFPGVVTRYISNGAGGQQVSNVGEGTAGVESGYNPAASYFYGTTWTSQTNSILHQNSGAGSQPTSDPNSIFQFGDASGSGAAGGFLLYPNKPNTNQLQSVYAK